MEGDNITDSERRLLQVTRHFTGQTDQPRDACIPQVPRPLRTPIRRAVIVTGCRTPFCKSFGDMLQFSSLDLGVAAVGGLLKKTKLDPNLVDEVIWGNVVLSTTAPNIGREIVIDLNLPRKIPGVMCSRACLSGLQAILQGVTAIEHGDADVIIAGGSDSLSNAEMPLPGHLTQALGKMTFGRKKGLPAAMQLLKDAGSPRSWLPTATAIAERSTGKTMGYHADLMAEINSVPREEQEQYALASHEKAAAATAKGLLNEEIVPLKTSSGRVISKDDLVRANQDAGKIAKLRPAFRKTGTVTAATSSALTDGGSAVLLMSEDKARQLGYPTDIFFRSIVMTAVEPYPQLLLAPAVAIPRALDIAGISLGQVDFVEMHEAFAAQVLSTLKALESPDFARRHLNRDGPVGHIDLSKLNRLGGSLALGHPFAATGGRIVTTATNELRRSGDRFALLSICAAGGLGGAAVIERRE